MDIQENEFSPEQSLRIIASMIETTKNSISDNSVYFLLWGWGILAASSIQLFMKAVLHNPYHSLAWLIMPFMIVAQVFLVTRTHRTRQVRTFIGEFNSYLWSAVGLAYLSVFFIFLKIGWDNCFSFYIIFFGIGTYVSGRLIKFKPLYYGGLICFPLALAAAYVDFDLKIVFQAVAILVSYIIPGHLLRLKHKKQHALHV